MTFQLQSHRLEALLSHVIDGRPMADIGTDHALVPIAAIDRGLTPRAIGIDRAPSALGVGRENVARNGPVDGVDLRLGDGLAPLSPDDQIATVVMAGVGAQTVLDVMDTERLLELGVERLVLQPNQSEIDARRAIFTRPAWRLADETLVEEEGRFYVVFQVDLDPAVTPRELDDISLEDQLLGPHLRRRGGERFRAYAAELAALLEPHLAAADTERMPQRVRARLERRLEVFRGAARE
jgi:tRNA (adenine22-N1)-methyltransferase